MFLNIKIYALLSFLLCLYCSVNESDPKSEFEIFKKTYYQNLNKKFEDGHSIFITLMCPRELPHDVKNWHKCHVFYMSFRLVKEEMIEINSSESYPRYIIGLDYPERKRITVPDEITKKFYEEMKKLRSNFGFEPDYTGWDDRNRELFAFNVYLMREEAKILLEMIEKYYNGLLTNEFENVSNPFLE